MTGSPGQPRAAPADTTGVSTHPRTSARPAPNAAGAAAAAADLRTLEQRNADLVARLSRDVGRPLAAIVGDAEAAIDEWEATPDELKLDRVDRIHLQARRLGQLVDDILTMCRLDSGAVQADRVPVVLGPAVDQALGAVPQLAGLAGLNRAGRVVALADPAHLRRILVALLANAASHGRPPVRVDAQGTGDGLVELRVRDHGRGVPAELVPRLFDRGSAWARPVPGPAAAVHGAGLGLFIAGRLAEANGATLAYEPNIPAGSCFTLRLEAFRS
jgi:signal transduction histidine kinase